MESIIETKAATLLEFLVVLETGPDRRSVTLTDGATIVGRLVRNGKPVPNAQIGLSHRTMADSAATSSPSAIHMK
jgi:hypothetical protein